MRMTFAETNLRYSQVSPLSMYEEVNTGDNLPAQIDLFADEGDEYHFLFIAKGGGSANKTFLFQQTKAVLNPKSLVKFVDEKIRTLGTAACPPYHLAIVIGGTSADPTLKTVKLATKRGKSLGEMGEAKRGGRGVRVDVRRARGEIRRTLSQFPIKPRLSLPGPLIVARDIAHAKLQERLERGEDLPQYAKDHPI